PRPPSPTLFPYTTLFRSRRRDDRHPFLACLFAHSRAPIPRGGFRPTAHRENMADQAVRNALPLSSPPATPCANTRLVRGVLSHRSEEHTSELQSLAYLVC